MVRSLIPWRERLPRPFMKLEEDMESMMERFFGPDDGWITSFKGFAPRANLVEKDETFELTVDLPGIKPEDVDVELKDGCLWISGERKEETEEKGKSFHRIERHFGEFRRVIPLPGVVDEEKVEAEYKEGVLKVTVAKTEKAKAKHIEVKA